MTEDNKKEVKQFDEVFIPAKVEDTKSVSNDLVVGGEQVISVESDLIKKISNEMSEAGFENLRKLCMQSEYTIGDKTYKGKKLRPQDLKDIRKVDKDYEDIVKDSKDPIFLEDQNLAVLKTKAFIHLGMTPEEFEETDIPLLQSIVTARDLRQKGWFRL
jgi:glutamine synthetase type III